MPFNIETIRLVTLDLDDTLWRTKPVIERAEEELTKWLIEHYPNTKANLSSQQQLACKKRVWCDNPNLRGDMTALRQRFLEDLLTDAGYPASNADTAMQIFLAWRNKVTLFDGVETGLAWLASRYPIIALSNGNADLEAIGIKKYFTASLRASVKMQAKPSTDMFIAACTLAQVDPKSVLHIGDDYENDIEPAASLGMQTAHISSVQTPQADICCAAFTEIIQALKNPAN